MTKHMTRGKGLNTRFANNTNGTDMSKPQIPLNPNPNLNEFEMSGEEFCKLMEKHRITAAMLGIDTTYKYKLCKGQRKPSKELVAKLIRMIQVMEEREKALKEETEIIDDRARSLAGRTPPSRGGFFDDASYDKSYDNSHIGNFASGHMPVIWTLNNSNHVGLYAELSRIVSQDLIQKWLEVSAQKDSKKTFQRNKMYAQYVFLLKDPVRLVKELLSMNYGKRTHVMKTISSYVKFVDMLSGTDYVDYVRKLFRKADLGWRDENIRVFEKQEILTEEQVLRVIEILKEHSMKLALRAWFMTETGLRTGETKLITWNNIDFESRIVKLMLIRRSKKAYFSFISKELADTLLKYKDKIMGRPFIVHSMREHYAEESIRKEIPYFRWYLFRKFNASYLVSKGIPESIVDLFQGRAPKSILQQSYLRLSLEYLRDLHDKAFSELSQKIQKILIE